MRTLKQTAEVSRGVSGFHDRYHVHDKRRTNRHQHHGYGKHDQQLNERKPLLAAVSEPAVRALPFSWRKLTAPRAEESTLSLMNSFALPISRFG